MYGATGVPVPNVDVGTNLSNDQRDFVKETFEDFGQYSPRRKSLHPEPPWATWRNGVIPHELLGPYFNMQIMI